MFAEPGLAGDDHLVFNDGAAGDACLRGNDHRRTDLGVVGDLDQVVDLASPADPSHPQRAAIHGGIGSDFHIVLDHDPACLGKLDLGGAVEHVAESVGPQHHAGVQSYPVTQLRAGIEDHPGMEYGVAADTAMLSHHHARAQNAAVAHPGSGPHHHVRSQVHLLSDDRLRRNHRGRMSHSPSGRAGMEQAGRAGKVQLGPLGNDGVPAGPVDFVGGDDAPGRQLIGKAGGPG